MNINTHTKNQKHFKRMIRIGKLRFYVTWNFRLKNSQNRDNERHLYDVVPLKEMLWEQTKGHCMECGRDLCKFGRSQIHHILPYAKFPQYTTDIRNLLLLCPKCHKHIHLDPFKECSMMQSKADEFGIDLKNYYDV